MAKKINIKAKPVNNSADSWVENREAAITHPKVEDKNKRLTIDIPESLHKKIKLKCTENGTTIAEKVREMLEAEFSN